MLVVAHDALSSMYGEAANNENNPPANPPASSREKSAANTIPDSHTSSNKILTMWIREGQDATAEVREIVRGCRLVYTKLTTIFVDLDLQMEQVWTFDAKLTEITFYHKGPSKR